MTTTPSPSSSLKSLRETLRNPSLSLEDLSFALSSTLQGLGVHPTSLSSARVSAEESREISRYLPSVQAALLGVLPTFLEPLRDAGQERLLRTLFVPSSRSDRDGGQGKQVRRAIALVSYLSLPSFLHAPKPENNDTHRPLTAETKTYLLSLLQDLSTTYAIADIFPTIYPSPSAQGGESSTRASVRDLQWDEAVRSVVGLPAKCMNAIGRWGSEGTVMDLPEGLEPKAYFDRLIVSLEELMYELSQRPEAGDISPIRLVFEKLAAIGLLSSRTPIDDPRQPSLFPALLLPLLAHMSPKGSSDPYPITFLPSLFLPLPTSTLATFVDSLLRHLSYRLIAPNTRLQPDTSDQRIKRAVQVFQRAIGPAKVGGEAWIAVLTSVSSHKSASGSAALSDAEHARRRLVVGWIALSGESAVKAFVEAVVDVWTDAKYIKFSLYARHLDLTHILLLALSHIPPYSPWLVGVSHRPRLIMAFQSYLAHPDPSIRRLGMLVAEVLSELTIPLSSSTEPAQFQTNENDIEELKAGLEVDEDDVDAKRPAKKAKLKRLKFTGMWDGKGEGREEAKWLRSSVGLNDGDVDVELESSADDWLLGWTRTTTPTVPAIISSSTALPASRGRAPQPHPPNGPSKSKSYTKSTFKSEPKPKIVMLDPDQLSDPLEGYATSSPSSSRSPSPTPSYLEEVAADPSLALDASSRNKVVRPVYIPQLAALLKEREKPECIEMGLKWGEGLVRAKREFGTELAENAVNVAMLAMGLNDPFNLDDFDEQRQGLMNALTACSPKEVAPFLCEQYFNTQYSLQQKSVILTALAMGARELAGQSVPQQPKSYRSIDFPTKTLPSALHKKYISPADMPRSIESSSPGRTRGQLEEVVDGVRGLLLSKGARKGDDVPEIAREKRLRVNRSTTKVAEVGTLSAHRMTQSAAAPPVIPFRDIAAEYFLLPLINRFWTYFHDSQIRESRAISSGSRYRGAGAGMVFSPMALEKFLMTLAVVLHAARHSPLFLAVLCPEALELATTVAARHPAQPSNDLIEDDNATREGEEAGDASVIAAAFEVALVSLDGAVDQDKGRTLAMDKPALVLATGEWAKAIFENETGTSNGDSGTGRGGLASGQGGLREGRLRAGAAGVVLKVAEIGEKWGHMGMGRY